MIIPDNKFFNQQWGLRLIKAQEAWTVLNGGTPLIGNSTEIAFGSPNVNIAIVDTGIETRNNIPISESFKGQLVNTSTKLMKNIITNSVASFDFYDFMTGSHGMGVSGISTAKAQVDTHPIYNGRGVVGVAPNCSFYSLTNEDSISRFLFMYGLSGLEFMFGSQFDYWNAINEAYGITSDGMINFRLYKKLGTVDEKKMLFEFLGNRYVDIFSLSLQITQATSSIGENYSKIFFNEMTFLGRNGRGCLFVIGAGNDGLDIEPTANQFLNEMAASNKPIIVGAISVDNSYNWLTGTPSPNPKRSSYSNFGSRIDVCAPGGGGITIGQEDNLIYSTTVKGAGQLLSESPIKLSLKTKAIDATRTYPAGSPYLTTHYASVELTFNNVNGVQLGQKVILGDFTGIGTFEVFDIVSINSNTIKVYGMTQTTYNSLKDSTTDPVPRTIFEFTPFFTKITQVFPSNKKLLQVESLKGMFKGADLYIGSLGNTSSGFTKKIVTSGINVADNQITLTSNVNANVGDYIVLPNKSSKVANLFSSGTKKIIVQDVEGFYVGASLIIESNSPSHTFFTSGDISSIETSSRTINFSKPLQFSSAVPPSSVDVFAKCEGTGDITQFFNGTSAATPFVSGIAALVLSANRFLSATEVKHIIKESASNVITSIGSPYVVNSDGYLHSNDYGTGLIDAEAAVQMALNWHTNGSIQKPTLRLFDNNSGTIVADNHPVDSPDIWVKPITEVALPIPSTIQPFNILDTTIDQKIFVRVRNTGSRKSFKECDIRVFVAFTDNPNPSFPFPEKWYQKIEVTTDDPAAPAPLHENVILLGIKEIPYIVASSETIVEFDWKLIQKKWSRWNPLNKKAYFLVHLAPFDGIDSELSLTNIRNNKNLSCRPINVTHFNSFMVAADGVKTLLPDDVYNLIVNPIDISKNFKLEISNILESRLNVLKFTFVKKSRASGAIEQTVVYRKAGASWAFDVAPTADWVKIEPAIAITDSTLSTPNYKNAALNFILTIDETVLEVTYDVST
jgi:subtilisin family serine protease